MTRILLIIIGLIAYGSLYPWQLRPVHLDSQAIATFLHAWPARFTPSDLGDIFVNLCLYVPVGLFAFLALERRGHRRLRWLLPIALGLLLSSSMEFLQIFDRSRVCSLLDVLNNTIGSAAGVLLGFFFRRSISGALLLIFYWLGYQLCLLFGIVTGGSRPAFLRSPIQTASLFFAWAVFAILIWRPRRGVLLTLAAAGFTALIVIRGLVPFHWQAHASTFSFIPFAAMFNADWIVGLPVFLEKSFYYGAAIWLWRATGLPMAGSIAIVAVSLAAIEIIQIHLPGRISEITDPLLALLLGFILWQLEREAPRSLSFEFKHAQPRASRM